MTDEKTCFCMIDKAFWAGDALFPVIHYVVQFVHVVLRLQFWYEKWLKAVEKNCNNWLHRVYTHLFTFDGKMDFGCIKVVSCARRQMAHPPFLYNDIWVWQQVCWIPSDINKKHTGWKAHLQQIMYASPYLKIICLMTGYERLFLGLTIH